MYINGIRFKVMISVMLIFIFDGQLEDFLLTLYYQKY